MAQIFPSSPHPAVFLDTVRAADGPNGASSLDELTTFISQLETHASLTGPAPGDASFEQYRALAVTDELAQLFRSLPRADLAAKVSAALSASLSCDNPSTFDAHALVSDVAAANAAHSTGFAVSVAPRAEATTFPTVPGVIHFPAPGSSAAGAAPRRDFKSSSTADAAGTGFDMSRLPAFTEALLATQFAAGQSAASAAPVSSSAAPAEGSVTVLSDGTRRVKGSALTGLLTAAAGRAHTVVFPQPPSLPAACVTLSASAAAPPVRVTPFPPAWALHSQRNCGPRVPRVPAYAPLVFTLDPAPHVLTPPKPAKGKATRAPAPTAFAAAVPGGSWSLVGVLVQPPAGIEAAFAPASPGSPTAPVPSPARVSVLASADAADGSEPASVTAAATVAAADSASYNDQTPEVLLTPYSTAFFSPAPGAEASEYTMAPVAAPLPVLAGGTETYTPVTAVTLPARPQWPSAASATAVVGAAANAPRVSLAHVTYLPHFFGLHALHPVYVFTPSPVSAATAAAGGRPSLLVDPVGYLVLVETPAARWAHTLLTAKDTVRWAWPRPSHALRRAPAAPARLQPTGDSAPAAAATTATEPMGKVAGDDADNATAVAAAPAPADGAVADPDPWGPLESSQARSLLAASLAVTQQACSVLAPTLSSMASLGRAMGMNDDSERAVGEILSCTDDIVSAVHGWVLKNSNAASVTALVAAGPDKAQALAAALTWPDRDGRTSDGVCLRLRLDAFPRSSVCRLQDYLGQFVGGTGGEAAMMMPSVAAAATAFDAAKAATADVAALAVAAAHCAVAGQAYAAAAGTLRAAAAAELQRSWGVDAARLAVPADVATDAERAAGATGAGAGPFGMFQPAQQQWVSPASLRGSARTLADRCTLLLSEQRHTARVVAAMHQWLAGTDVDVDVKDPAPVSAPAAAAAGVSPMAGSAPRAGAAALLWTLHSSAKARKVAMDHTFGDASADPFAALFGGALSGGGVNGGVSEDEKTCVLREKWAEKLEVERGVVIMSPRVDPLFFTQPDAYKHLVTLIERLESPAIRVGAARAPAIGAASPGLPRSMQAILSALYHGMGYVAQDGGRLVFLNDQNIAFLPLDAVPRARPVVHRARDVARVLRKMRKDLGLGVGGKTLSLRVNWDFDAVIGSLNSHHESSWVTEELAGVWRAMHRAGTMLTLELYLGDELVAADIAHPVARAVYIATRYSSRAHKQWQPGFILALVSAQVLKQAGFLLWSLGGVDQSALMAYKHEIAVTEPGAAFCARFRAVRALGPLRRRTAVTGAEAVAGVETVPVYCPFTLPSVVIEDVTDAHVLKLD